MMNYYDEIEGGIFFVPLFLPNNIKDNRKNYYKHKFSIEDQYAFGRLIESNKSSGDLVEIFNYVGCIPDEPDTITESGQMFDPLHVAMGFEKKRWRFVFINKSYNKNVDSNYDHISFLLGDYDEPELWTGGKELGSIEKREMNKYNHWVVHASTQLEDKIQQSLLKKGSG